MRQKSIGAELSNPEERAQEPLTQSQHDQQLLAHEGEGRQGVKLQVSGGDCWLRIPRAGKTSF